MYKREKFCIEPPNQNQILWRFMNRNKFQGIMGQKKLFFANIKSFEDHTENKYTEGTHKNYVKPLSSYGNKNFCIAQNLSETKAIKDLNDFTDNKGNCIFASCWHMCNTDTPTPLWSDDYSISIKSTFNNLINVFYDDEITASVITYLEECEVMEIGTLPPAIYKRIKFEFEHELGLITWDKENYLKDQELKGKLLSVDLEQLIDEIYIHPDADTEFLNFVQGLVNSNMQKSNIVRRV